MSEILITFPAYGPNLSGTPIPGEVVDANLDTVWSGNLRVDGEQLVTASPGPYLVRAFTPSGGVLSRQVDIKEGARETVRLAPSVSSPRETLLRPMLLQGFARSAHVVREVSELSVDDVRSVNGWIRFWRRTPEGDWKTANLSPTGHVDLALEHVGPNVLTSAEFSVPEGSHWMQLGGEQCPWKFVALPGLGRVQVVVTQDELPDPSVPNDPIHVLVSAGPSEVESLLGFLARGEIEQSRVVFLSAEGLLQEKVADPYSACVGGYFLLLAGEREQLHDWPYNLGAMFPWLPDAAVIAGWHSLRSGPSNAQLARTFFLRAASSGPPMYAHGLRLLAEGLALFAEREGQDQDDAAISALAKVRGYMAAVVTASASTAFYAENPTQPSRKFRFGDTRGTEPPPMEFGARRPILVR